MGTDIHVVIEYRYAGVQRWEFLGELEWNRDYSLFHRLSGSRCNCVDASKDCKLAVAQPRGMPVDATYETRGLLGTDQGLHTPSWLTVDEFRKAVGEDGHEVQATLAMMESLKANQCDARVVFAYDS